MNYELSVISHHKDFNGKSLRKYHVDGIDTIGAYGDEPFSIVFRNHTYQKVQVKLSLDGTDILTGKPATTETSKDMWVVSGYGSLTLKAWPETDQGGAGFVFTSADNSVAIHTHGDLSSRGIIAAAVFTEGHVEPIKASPPIVIQQQHHHHHDHYPYYPYYQNWPYNPDYSIIYGGNFSFNGGGGTYGSSGGGTYTSSNAIPRSRGLDNSKGSSLGNVSTNNSFNAAGFNGAGATADCLFFNETAPAAASEIGETNTSASLEKLVSVGAGQQTEQKITYVAGLIKPLFTETVRVKYLWWDDLVTKLRTETSFQAQPSGFPGDAKQKNIDLKGTPRIGSKQRVRRVEQEPVFDRF